MPAAFAANDFQGGCSLSVSAFNQCADFYFLIYDDWEKQVWMDEAWILGILHGVCRFDALGRFFR